MTKRLLATPLFVLLVGAVISCTSADENNDSTPVTGNEIPCALALAAEGLEHTDICLDASDGYDVITVRPEDGVFESVVIVDPGGPVVDVEEAVGLIQLIEAAQRGSLDSAYLVLTPKNLSVPQECESAKPPTLPKDCDLTAVATTHFEGYQESLTKVLGWFDDSIVDFHLLASSFGAARWESILVGEDAPVIDKGVFMSPLTGGTSVSEFGDGLTMAARVVFQQIVDGCTAPECFVIDDPVDPANCTAFLCRPDAIIADVAGVNQEEALVGMFGLLSAAEVNAVLLHEAIADEDGELLGQYLEQGRASFFGIDSFGFYTAEQIHFLSAACSVLEHDGSQGLGVFDECAGMQTRPEFGSAGSEFRPETKLPDTCFYSPQPDPLLGYAANDGNRFGNSMRSSVERLRQYVHGDLVLGAERLVEFIETGTCPAPLFGEGS